MQAPAGEWMLLWRAECQDPWKSWGLGSSRGDSRWAPLLPASFSRPPCLRDTHHHNFYALTSGEQQQGGGLWHQFMTALHFPSMQTRLGCGAFSRGQVSQSLCQNHRNHIPSQMISFIDPSEVFGTTELLGDTCCLTRQPQTLKKGGR